MNMKESYLSILKNIVMFVDEPGELPDFINSLDEYEIHKLCVVAASKEVCLDMDLPEIVRNLDNYAVEFSIHNYFDLGKYWIENMVPNNGEVARYLHYVDYRWLGKDLCAEGVGIITPYGILW